MSTDARHGWLEGPAIPGHTLLAAVTAQGKTNAVRVLLANLRERDGWVSLTEDQAVAILTGGEQQ